VPELTRRNLLRGGVVFTGVLATGGLAACGSGSGAVSPTSSAVTTAEAARKIRGRQSIAALLNPRPATIDLGGRTVDTWAYGDSVPGPLLRATAGDLVTVKVDNGLPTETSVHWHGIALRNDMDGVPGLTQDPIRAGSGFTYQFTAPDPGTYFYHPHSGVQLDRGLYGVLVVDDPAEPGHYDHEWVVVLDDWLDGTGRTPDQVLARLHAKGGSDSGMSGMDGMDHGSMGGMHMTGGAQSRVLGGAGDVTYPYFLVNGRTPEAPVTLTGKAGQRARIRFVNAGSDTAFRVALGGHRMTVTHSDGYPVVPTVTDALLIGMGERYDVILTLGDGAFPLVASAEGKPGQGLAVVRTGAGSSPLPAARPSELHRRVLLGTDLIAAPAAHLQNRHVDRSHDLLLSGSMTPYRWTINGKTFPDTDPLVVTQGERVRLRFTNMSMMFHPMHVHGHTFAVEGTGVRKDTVIVRPMQTLTVDLDADNPGQWATHCHNIYHAESGMMTTLSYRT
jgi:multicopper oxidase